MNEVKCECGHINPHGTVLCEACGKELSPIAQKLLDMRYEGSARRSQTYQKTIIDKIWVFFSSVKVGICLIVITLIASAVGTILPQEMYIPPVSDTATYYEDQYGFLGKIYYVLGFHHLYGSWWYLLLIASIGVSLVICSLDRIVPLYRALNAQRVIKDDHFLMRQRLFSMTEKKISKEAYQKLKENLKAKRYHIREDKNHLLAEKGRFSRWGPYINHIGLIIFLIGAMLRFVPGMYVDDVLWLREGETKVIPDTNGQYYIKNHQFLLEVYDKKKDNEVFQNAIDRAGIVAKNYQTNITLYEKKGNSLPGEKPKLEKIKDYPIRVNQPLKFEGYALYQVDYKLDELNQMSFALIRKETQEEFGSIKVDLFHPKKKYELQNGYSVELVGYFPDFEFNEDGKPTTKSKIPNNPAFVFKMYSPEKPEGEVSFAAIMQTIEPSGDNLYKMAFKGAETKNVSALTVRKDLTLWLFIVGGVIFMIGVIQGSYWNHRRIWIRRDEDQIWTAAHTNKNWYGLKNELKGILVETEISEPIDQLPEKRDS
ncbi:cytochrome c biogenesis protein ResB [Bacillus sp. 03113]|uniref:cytochrome c biogenesis protein ResB n=1 Tax=Bacillus sp. 03113 TaxID=2578211 RepID=UPI001141C778|nr:cytochrome c biogenesis protein ResB [Bacillus sp. 03113]